MDKSKQLITNNKTVGFWQQRSGNTLQRMHFRRWLMLLVFLGMSSVTVLVWQSLLKNSSIQVNRHLELKTAPIKPQTKLQQSSATPLIFAGLGVNLEITRILVKQFQQTHPEIKMEEFS